MTGCSDEPPDRRRRSRASCTSASTHMLVLNIAFRCSALSGSPKSTVVRRSFANQITEVIR